MVEPASRYPSYQPDNDTYDYPDNDRYDENPVDHYIKPYRFGQSVRTLSGRKQSVPLFLSDSNGEPHPDEYMSSAPIRPRVSLSSRILAVVLATAAMAVVFAAFSSDATRDIIVSAKASIASVLPAPSAAAQPDSTRLTAADILVKDPTRLNAPANQTPGVKSVATVAIAPTRTEIASAYQNAVQGRAPAGALSQGEAPPAASAASPAARRLDADELASLLTRAKGLLTAGDIPPARLLLERAADAQQANAALLLAQTYDPDVVGAQDIRNITPDPAIARAWYQRAAQLGSADAQRRLSQLQN
jgi:hypothetical protein